MHVANVLTRCSHVVEIWDMRHKNHGNLIFSTEILVVHCVLIRKYCYAI